MKCDPRSSVGDLVIILTSDPDGEDFNLRAEIVADVDLVQTRVSGCDVEQKEGAIVGIQLRSVVQLLQDHG